MSAFGEVLFHRSAQSDENSDRNDIWDDEILIKSYDKALKIAQEQVAKRIAQSTNNLGPPKENDKSEPSTSKKSKHKNKNTWQTKNSGKIGKLEVGAYCRAPYSEDQKDYEATILRKIDKDRCLVRFIGKCFTLSQSVSTRPSRSIIIEIRHKDVRPSFKQLQLKCVEQLYEHAFSEGNCQLLDFTCGHINLSFYLSYDNEEEVLLSELKPSSGDDARVEQIKVATMLDIKLDFEHNAEDMESLEPMEQSVEESVEKPAIRKMTRHFKKRNHMANMPNPFQFGLTGMPSMPPYPSLPMGDLPPLPPPMPFPLAGLTGTDDDTQEQQQAMSSMLLSWYMSGYYTGIYQGTMKANSSKCKNCHKRKT